MTRTTAYTRRRIAALSERELHNRQNTQMRKPSKHPKPIKRERADNADELQHWTNLGASIVADYKRLDAACTKAEQAGALTPQGAL